MIALKRSMSNMTERQRPLVPGGAGQLAVEEFEQVPLVVDLRQGVDDRQPVDLLVILGFDVAAGEEAVDAVADPEVIAVVERWCGDRAGR